MISPFFRLQTLEETTSTNDAVALAARAGEAEGLVIRAVRQTAGRGRRGRVWDSPPGNLYCSVLLRPACPGQAVGFYTFAVALAVYDTVTFFAPGGTVEVKWPNDVLLNGGKVSGILLETDLAPDGAVAWLAIGVGINVTSCPTDAPYPTACLQGVGIEVVLEKHLESLARWKKTLESEGFEPLRRTWLSRAKGGKITVRTAQGEARGDFAGLDASGCLILRDEAGLEKKIAAADVFF